MPRGSTRSKCGLRSDHLSRGVVHARMPAKVFHIRDVLTTVHVGGIETQGAYAMIEQRHPPGRGAPVHYHQREAESLYVLEGEYAILLDGRSFRLNAGEAVTVPAGVPHAFLNKGPGVTRLLVTVVPAGIEEYLAALSGIDFDASDGPAKVRELDARYGIVQVRDDSGTDGTGTGDGGQST